MDSILFYGDRGEATRRQVRSAAASHSHRIGPRKAKASKKPKNEEQSQHGKKRKLESCGATTGKFVIEKPTRPPTTSPPKVDNATKEKVPRQEVVPLRYEVSPASTASSLDNDINGRLAPITLELPRIEQQPRSREQLLPIKTDYSSPSLMVSSSSLDHPPRSDPYCQHSRPDSAADPLVVTRIHPRMDSPRYERSFDGRLHLVTSTTAPPPQHRYTSPVLRVLPEPSSFTRPTSQSSELFSDQGMRTPRRCSGNAVEDDRLRMPPAS